MEGKKTEKTEVRDAIVAAWIETGEDITVKVIAALLGWSEAKVRRHLTDASGFVVEGFQRREEGRTSYSRDYRGFESGSHKVSVYGPTREFLRQMLIAKGGAR